MATIQQEKPLAVDVVPETLPYELPRKGTAKVLHACALFVLNRIPKKLARFLFLLASRQVEETRTVFQGAATYKALEVMYTFPARRAAGKATPSGEVWWSLLDNARSIWNRLLVVQEELRLAIQEISSRNSDIRLLSIGSGSARPVLQTISNLPHTLRIHAMLIDQDQTAIRFSQELANLFNVNGTVEYVAGNFLKIVRRLTFQPNIIEMVGLLDYLDDRLAMLLLRQVYSILAPGGWFITGNIAPNHERIFVERGINWTAMHHRTEMQVRNLLYHAGFPEPRIRKEPLGIHMVAVVRKPG